MGWTVYIYCYYTITSSTVHYPRWTGFPPLPAGAMPSDDNESRSSSLIFFVLFVFLFEIFHFGLLCFILISSRLSFLLFPFVSFFNISCVSAVLVIVPDSRRSGGSRDRLLVIFHSVICTLENQQQVKREKKQNADPIKNSL